MNIAVDVGVSEKTIAALQGTGFKVVAQAEQGEDDESWVIRAINNGADIIVSSDLDIPNLLDRYEYPVVWLELPQGKINQYNFIVKTIKNMERMSREKL